MYSARQELAFKREHFKFGTQKKVVMKILFLNSNVYLITKHISLRESVSQ
jgi:hypothetical protein